MARSAWFVVVGCAVGAACSAGQLREASKKESGTPALAMPFASTPRTPPALAERDAEAPPAGPAAPPPPPLEPTEVAEEAAPPEAVSEAEPEPSPVEEYRAPTLVAVARETMIYSRPSFKSPKLGYLRVGAAVGRSAAPVGNDGCKRGWYRVQPEGFVCLDGAASLDTEGPSPFAELAVVRPDRMAGLPYAYGRSRYPTPPFYSKLPSKLEQERAEQDLVGHLRARTAEAWKSLPNNPLPIALGEGRAVPLPFGFARDAGVVTGRAMPDSGFALLGVYEHEGRRFALNTDFQLLPLDRLKPVEVSRFHGIRLDEQVTLPVAFVRSQNANLYTGDPKKTGLSIARKLDYREAVPLSGREIIVSGIHYLETKTGDFIRDERLVRIDKLKYKPGWAKPGRSWLHVSILQQSLVMYEGEKPVYATLVSTGVDGLGDPTETHSTVRGQFLIHTKHVSVTMDSDAEGDEFDLRDVPYVQYFQEGYALHAAFWHDSFGQPYSHGCVNLSPLDARALFHLTSPPVPQTWHAAMSLRGGTLVHITP